MKLELHTYCGQPTDLCSRDDVSPVHLLSVVVSDLYKPPRLKKRAKNVSIDIAVEAGSLKVLPAKVLLPVAMNLIQGNQYCMWENIDDVVRAVLYSSSKQMMM